MLMLLMKHVFLLMPSQNTIYFLLLTPSQQNVIYVSSVMCLYIFQHFLQNS